ncbi:molybdopterin-synthase adenylyltransferase MoeB [Olleya sp. AH-315-F22]|nr:molybdopterin-synthase adenylyltransferase MoeB [Olleya sp. AH-315-F22]
MNRYNRHIILSEIGQKGQDKLSNAKILVVGAGGLGCPVLQYLTAAGIGIIGIIDFDIVEESNLQRQVLFGTASLGKNKAIAAKKRLTDLNNTITINAHPNKLTHKNALDFFKNYDIIVDGTDNFATRYLINDASIITKKPLVYGAIYKFEGQVAVFNFQKSSSYRCLFPTPPKEGTIPNCSEIGVLGVLPGIIGSMQANEVIKIILGLGSILSGKLLCYNALTTQTTTLKINRIEEEINKVLSKKENFDKIDEELCEFYIPEISIDKAFKKKNIQFIDVREYAELPKVEELNPLCIPLSELENNLEKIDFEKEKIIFCQSGIRSKKAVSILQKHNINNSYSVKEGALGIIDYLTQLQKQH